MLAIFGDALDNSITVSRNAAGTILVNGGAVRIKGDTPTVANTRVIQVYGVGGHDNLALDEATGALPRLHISWHGHRHRPLTTGA